MSLSNGEVAALASQVADLVTSSMPDNPNVDVRISPSGLDDAYRWTDAAGWIVYFDVGPTRSDTVAARIIVDDSPGWALYRMIDGLSEYISDTTRYWAVAFPRCPGHRHPARVDIEGEQVVLRCPQTREIVTCISPEVP